MTGKSINISKMRLAAQQLSYTSLQTAEELVGWFGAVQGQEYAQTKWGLALRIPKLSDVAIESKLTDGTLLRTHLLRPTWHFVTAADIGWLLALTAARVNAVNAFMYRKLELNSRVLNKCNTIIEKVLQGGQHLTRDEINARFRQNKIQAEGLRLIYIMMQAELEGIICSGAKRANQFTYALLAERAKKPKALTREEALAELTKRYFQSRGPATVKDFSTWSGLTMNECSRGIDMNNTILQKITVNDNDHYFIPVSFTGRQVSRLYLLPVYDECIMGYKDRSAFFELKQRSQPNPPLHFDCMIMYQGQIIGTWKRTMGNKKIELGYQLFDPLNLKQQKEFNKAVKWLSDFNGMTVALQEVK